MARVLFQLDRPGPSQWDPNHTRYRIIIWEIDEEYDAISVRDIIENDYLEYVCDSCSSIYSDDEILISVNEYTTGAVPFGHMWGITPRKKPSTTARKMKTLIRHTFELYHPNLI